MKITRMLPTRSDSSFLITACRTSDPVAVEPLTCPASVAICTIFITIRHFSLTILFQCCMTIHISYSRFFVTQLQALHPPSRCFDRNSCRLIADGGTLIVVCVPSFLPNYEFLIGMCFRDPNAIGRRFEGHSGDFSIAGQKSEIGPTVPACRDFG